MNPTIVEVTVYPSLTAYTPVLDSKSPSLKYQVSITSNTPEDKPGERPSVGHFLGQDSGHGALQAVDGFLCLKHGAS